jgi:hypothetical protein
MKLYDPKNLGKPQIRLPSDDDNGPNPYDSKTPFQPADWLTWKWWSGIASLGIGFVLMRDFLDGKSFF